MYYPSLDEVRKLHKHGNLIPVYREINADLETPVSAYLKIARGDYSFLLESVEGGERLARYSFIGTEPSLIVKTDAGSATDPLLLIEKEFKRFQPVTISGLPRFHGGMVGYLSYEVARYFERLPSPDHDPLKLPESLCHTLKLYVEAAKDDAVDPEKVTASVVLEAILTFHFSRDKKFRTWQKNRQDAPTARTSSKSGASGPKASASSTPSAGKNGTDADPAIDRLFDASEASA